MKLACGGASVSCVGQIPGLDQIRRTAERGEELGLRVFAGHGLTSDNVGPVSRLPQVEELNIGHSVVSRAVLVGIDAAVRELLQAMHA